MNRRFPIAAFLLLAGTAGSAHATTYIDTSLTALPSNGFVATDLSGVTAPDSSTLYFQDGGLVTSAGPYDETISFNVANGQGVVQGSSSGQYAAPFTADGAYTGNYFSTGTGSITITFATDQLAMALLWGSVDSYNQVQLFEGSTLVGSVAGSDIEANANGSQGYGGSFYTLINSTVAFDEVVLSSTSPSFEFAQFEADVSNDYVPEPASLAVFGVGLLGLAALRRRAI